MSSEELVKRLRNALLDNKELQETLGQTNDTLEKQIEVSVTVWNGSKKKSFNVFDGCHESLIGPFNTILDYFWLEMHGH